MSAEPPLHAGQGLQAGCSGSVDGRRLPRAVQPQRQLVEIALHQIPVDVHTPLPSTARIPVAKRCQSRRPSDRLASPALVSR